MSRIKRAIYDELVSAATTAAGRVYPVGEVPTSAARPYITFQKISNTHTGHQGGGSGLAHARYQFNCWADTANAADVLADEVRKHLDYFTGDMGTAPNTVDVRVCVLDNDIDDFEQPTDASQVGRFVNRLDFVIHHRETVTPV